MNNLTYVGMTMVGAAAMVYSVHSGRTIWTDDTAATVIAAPTNPNELLATFMPLMDAADADVTLTDVEPELGLEMGMTAFAVRDEMGTPPAVTSSGRVWRYPTATILFDDARQVVGWTAADYAADEDDGSDFSNVFLDVRPAAPSRARTADNNRNTRQPSSNTRSTPRRRNLWSAPDSGRRDAFNSRQQRSYRNESRHNRFSDNRARLTSSWLYRTSRRSTSGYVPVPAGQRRRVDVYGNGNRYEGRFQTRSRNTTNRVQRSVSGRFGTVRDGYIRGR